MPCKHCSPRPVKICPVLCPATTYSPTDRRCTKPAVHASRLGLVCGIHRLALQSGRRLALAVPEK